jgi:hypothetical protein
MRRIKRETLGGVRHDAGGNGGGGVTEHYARASLLLRKIQQHVLRKPRALVLAEILKIQFPNKFTT